MQKKTPAFSKNGAHSNTVSNGSFSNAADLLPVAAFLLFAAITVHLVDRGGQIRESRRAAAKP